MNDLRLAARQLRYENRSFWRNPAAAFFTFVFPLMFLVIFNLIFGSDTTPRFCGGGREYSLSTFFIPAIAAFSVITACYTNISIGVVFSRDEGVLKRIRGTPLPAASYLSARIVHAILIAIILVVIVVTFGRAFYDVDLPSATLPAFVVSLAVGAACFAALGLAVTGFIPNPDAAPAVVNASILPLLFISDVFIPLDSAPKWLGYFADVFPVKHFSHALIRTYDPCAVGGAWQASDLLVMAAWMVGGLLVAVKTFSWEPRT
jgi:ABC-2 type transport system permease protein